MPIEIGQEPAYLRLAPGPNDNEVRLICSWGRLTVTIDMTLEHFGRAMLQETTEVGLKIDCGPTAP